MSYILDALKRSEQERRQGQIPSVVAPNTLLHVTQRRTQLWPYLLIGVLLLNALVYAFFRWQAADTDIPDVPQDGSAPQVQATPAELKTGTFSPIAALLTHPDKADPDKRQEASSVAHKPLLSPVEPEVADYPAEPTDAAGNVQAAAGRDYNYSESNGYNDDYNDSDVETAEFADTDPVPDEIIRPKAVAQSLPDEVPPVVTSTRSEPLSAPAPEPEPALKTMKAVSRYDQVPQLSDMDLTFQKTVPDMVFNSHIYSANPSARRVMINSNYLREGQHFTGLELVEVGEFDIVLRTNDVLFKMPVLRDWARP